MDEDERLRAALLVQQNRKIKAKTREQARVFREERSKLLAVRHSLRQSLDDQKERNRLAIEEFNQRITELEVELRRAQADPRIPLLPLALESRLTREIPRRAPNFSDLEAENERLMEETNRIMHRCGWQLPDSLTSHPPATLPKRSSSSGSSARPRTADHSSNGPRPPPSRAPVVEEEEEEEAAPTLPPPAPSPRRSSSSGHGMMESRPLSGTANEPGGISGRSSGIARSPSGTAKQPSDIEKQPSGTATQPRQSSGGGLELPDQLSGFGSGPDDFFNSPPGSRQLTQPAGQQRPQGSGSLKPFEPSSGGWGQQGDSGMSGSFGELDLLPQAARPAPLAAGHPGGAGASTAGTSARRSSDAIDLVFGSDLDD